jgi:hypothetical protein
VENEYTCIASFNFNFNFNTVHGNWGNEVNTQQNEVIDSAFSVNSNGARSRYTRNFFASNFTALP